MFAFSFVSLVKKLDLFQETCFIILGLLDLNNLIIWFAVYPKHSSFWPSTDVKWFSACNAQTVHVY